MQKVASKICPACNVDRFLIEFHFTKRGTHSKKCKSCINKEKAANPTFEEIIRKNSISGIRLKGMKQERKKYSKPRNVGHNADGTFFQF